MISASGQEAVRRALRALDDAGRDRSLADSAATADRRARLLSVAALHEEAVALHRRALTQYAMVAEWAEKRKDISGERRASAETETALRR